MTRRVKILGAIACALALAALILGGCGSSTPKGGTLEGVTWVLASYAVDGAMKTPPADAYAYATFAAGKLSGRVLNSYQGPYQATSKGGLKISPVASTQMGGSPELMALETAYLANMPKVTSYRTDDAKLTLYDADGKTLVEFARSTGTITDRDWAVVGYDIGTQTLSSVLAGTLVTARFGPDGKLTGNGGINDYSAEYTVTPAGVISIGAITATKMAGPPEVTEQERNFLAALKSASSYILRGQRLELLTADGAIAVSLSE